MDGEPARLGLPLEDEHQRLAPPPAAGQFHEQGHMELADALAESLLELLATDGEDPRPRVDGAGLGKEARRIAR